MHRLKITNCRNHIDQITLTEGTHTIGRTLDSTLRLEGEEVSRLHARLLIRSNLCELIDESSKNGTFINGKRIKSQLLQNGDKIQIGKFNIQFTTDSAKPHYLSGSNKNIPKQRFLKIIIALSLLISTGLFFYQYLSTKKTSFHLAERTAEYLAEKNKEALYLGEYDSINLANLPKQVIQISIWDRNNTLRANHPKDAETLPGPKKTDTIQTYKTRGKIQINMPIYYDSIRVGTLGIIYKL